uniref:Chaoptin n=1 Tax=Timema monikensis TaxID=170555 RepID=A0A7R9DWY5_9NEOP|nr:unnamed protein product [Timema monikensis]
MYRLEISHNPLPDIPSEAFVGLERSLWELELQHNQLMSVPSRSIRHLQKLRRLDLTGNRISEIFPENWRGLENSLQTLILADNTLSSLPPDAFSNLPNLETLDMSGNDLLGFDPSTFHNGPARLSSLYLADNQLTSIPYQQVSALRLLRTLDLSGNMISHLHSATSEPEQPGVQLSLDTLRLDYNQIQYLPPGSFQHFDILNRTFLDGNPLFMVEADAFRDARIRELSLRDCGVTALSPGAFSGLEPSLQLLDLAGNNLTVLPNHLFHDFDFLRTLYLAENRVAGVNPGDALNGFQYSLYRLDLSGRQMGVTALHDLRRIRNLRSIIMSKLPQNQIGPDDFVEFGVDLEEIKIQESNLKTLKNHAFKHVRGLKRLDLSENNIKQVEPDAFLEVGHSLTFLRVAHGFSSSMSSVPSESLKPLVNLQYLDLSNNRFSSMPETSFHFLRKLRILELQDNQLDQVHKGTFQGGIHSSLEKLYLSYNNLNSINTHTFVDLSSLERLHLDDNRIIRVERRAFMNMDRLKHLDLRGNKIQSISDEAFQNLPELQTLDLAYNELKGFDFAAMDQVGVLASFRLNMSHNRMQSLEVNVSSLSGREGGLFHSNIKVLDLSHNNVSWIARGYLRPLEISVTHLYLGNNALQNATREVFGNMPHLQWLDLSGNSISELDFDVFRNTRRLQVVRLDHNLLTDIPSELFRSLSSLRVVDLSSNRLRNLPDGLFMDEGMESLRVSHNQLGRVPASCLGTSAAATLVEMDLSHNLIASLQGSEMFTRLRSLSRLDLSSNKITRIDDGTFSPLNRLAHLDLSHNQGMLVENKGRGFKGLEDSLLYLGLANCSMVSVPELPLHGLRSLDLSHNYFPDMPLEMTVNMTSLRRLDLSYNDLSTVPMVAQSLPQLRELSLAGNPITSLTNTTMIGGAQRLKELDIRQLPLNFFEGVRSPRLHFVVRNSSLDVVPRSVFQEAGWVRNLTVDVRHNRLRSLGNPSTADFPGLPRATFLTDLQVADNHWSCDCDIGWVEVWQRKKRQYLCGEEDSEERTTCRRIDDDLRLARCANKNNASLIEVLKADVEDDAFEGLENLESLSLKDNNILLIPASALGRLPHLSVLQMDFNRVAALSGDILRSVAGQVTSLSLARNVVRELPQAAFQEFKNLVSLDLTGNLLNIIAPSTFTGLEQSLQTLYLGQNRLAIINNQPFVLPQLKVLDFSRNQLREISRVAFTQLSSLRYLNLSHNQQLGGFHSSLLHSLPQLTILDLSFTGLKLLTSEVLTKSHNLEKVFFEGNMIQEVPEATFNNLPNLTIIDLSNNNILNIRPGAFSGLTKIKQVFLNGNRLSAFKGEFFRFPRGSNNNAGTTLEELDISHNELSYLFPSSFRVHPRLRRLLVSDNNFSFFPAELISTMHFLEHLDLGRNLIKSVEDLDFARLPSLRCLLLSHNQIESLSESAFHNSTQLQVLDFSDNKLERLGERTFEGLARIEMLDLSNNLLSELPDSIFERSRLQMLENINLSSNKFEIAPLRSLQRQYFFLSFVDLSRNNLKDIPPEDSIMVNIKRLDLSFNPLSKEAVNNVLAEPKTVRELNLASTGITSVTQLETPFLRHLNLSHNEITQLPDKIFERPTLLEVLDVSYNKLSDMSESMSSIWPRLKNLQYIDISGNAISAIVSGDFDGLESLRYLKMYELDECTLIKKMLSNHLGICYNLFHMGIPDLVTWMYMEYYRISLH